MRGSKKGRDGRLQVGWATEYTPCCVGPLDRITTASLQVGGPDTGSILVNEHASPAAAGAFELSADAVNLEAPITVSGGSLTITATGDIDMRSGGVTTSGSQTFHASGVIHLGDDHVTSGAAISLQGNVVLQGNTTFTTAGGDVNGG